MSSHDLCEKAFTPLTLVSLGESPLAMVRTGTHPLVLPFDCRSCTLRTIRTQAEQDAVQLAQTKSWRLSAKGIISLDLEARRHWVLLTDMAQADKNDLAGEFALPLDDTTTDGIDAFSAAFARAVTEACGKAHRRHDSLRIFLMSEPPTNARDSVLTSSSDRQTLPCTTNDSERVFLADTPEELAEMVKDVLHAVFVQRKCERTAVVWPAELPFPVNVHAFNDSARHAEHEELLLPRRGALRSSECASSWDRVCDLTRALPPTSGSSGSAAVRRGVAWEKHLVTNPHVAVKKGPEPVIEGARLLCTTGSYDYYHYRVDGFKDDGWGCAYRSLQTILSWFQHEGMVSQTMPSLVDIQKILSAVDPDKMNRQGFVGSTEWIGSYEIMLVLQHYVPGLECTIKRLESGAELDTDPTIQSLLFDHFSQEHASPVMIGGSSYAHTILGVYMNLHTTEAQYLVLDPHYSANPTNLKAAVNKGYVGWKNASKFFEASKWYNVCIPRTDQYDPR